MTTFPSNFRLFRTFTSLCLPLLTWLLLLPLDANSQQRHTADEQQTVEIRNPRSHNPLAPSEMDRGKFLAESSEHVKRVKRERLAQPRNPVQSLKPLYVQRHNDKNDDPNSRKADVFYYDYSKNEAIRVVVDLNSNTVQDTQVASGAANQPYFTRAEVETALQLIFDDPHIGPLFKKAYKDITGSELVDVVSQLQHAQGGIYRHDLNVPLKSVTADCVTDRCMELFIPIDDVNFIDMSNIVVDLSKMQVLSVAGPTPHIH
jgi:hypothetical protein